MDEQALDFIMYLGTGMPPMNKSSMPARQFHSTVIHVMPFGSIFNMTLALNTMLFFYENLGSSVKLYERYQIRGGPVVEEVIGLWTEDNGFAVTVPSIWERRSNLHGASLRFITPRPVYPLLHQIDISQEGEVLNYSGFLLEVLKVLEKEMNFTSEISFSVDKKFGSLVEGEWNGMVGMLIRNETDMCSFLTYTPQRHQAIGYTIPIMPKVPVSLIAPRRQGRYVNVWVFMDIFPNHVWFIFGGGLVSLSFGFTIIQISHMNDFHKLQDSENFGITNSLALTAIILMQWSYDVTVKTISAKLIFFSASLGLYVIFVIYSADMTARMTSMPPTVPIKSFQDVIDRDYKVVTRPGTSNHEFLKTSAVGSPMHSFYYENMHEDPTAFIPKLGDALSYIRDNEKTLLYAPMINILGKSGDYEMLIMHDTIYTQVNLRISNKLYTHCKIDIILKMIDWLGSATQLRVC